MIPFQRFAFFTVARDAAFVMLAAATMMVGASFQPALAFKIGATVALLFSLALLIRVFFLTEERFLRSEPWCALRPDERPQGEGAHRIARRQFQGLLLRAAKAAAGTAGLLYFSAMVLAASSVVADL
jgi:hypothetical protein